MQLQFRPAMKGEIHQQNSKVGKSVTHVLLHINQESFCSIFGDFGILCRAPLGEEEEEAEAAKVS